MEEYFRTYNVKFLISDISNSNYLSEEDKQCWNNYFYEGSANFKFIEKGSLKLNNSQYKIFSLRPQNLKSVFRTSSVELIHADQIKFLEDKPFEVLKVSIMNLRADCYSKNPVSDSSFYLHRSDEDAFKEFLKSNHNPMTSPQTSPINFKKISENKFEFDLPRTPSWFIFKMSPQPGMELFDDLGNKLPIFRSYPHMISYGQGKISLKIIRTPIMILGYMISILTFLGSIIYFFVYKRRLTITGVQDEHPHNP